MTRATGWRRFRPARRGSGARQLRLAAWLAVLGAAAATPETAAAQGATARREARPHVWLDAEGEPLPFQTDAEIAEFLRTAPVVSRRTLDVGVNRSEQLVLEKDGTRARAIFRVADLQQRDVRIGARFYFDFRDSYRHECAAYELARWLGLDSVPPTVPRQLDGTDGSVQIWIENARDEEKQGFKPPDVRAWVAQVWDKDLFDNLILNVDRNAGNVLVGQQYRLWLIDHTRGFQPERQLLDPERVARVQQGIWERLLALTEEDLRGLVGDYLDGQQLTALAQRRQLLVDHVEQLVADRGADAVFY